MRKNKVSNYPLQLLAKSVATLEINMKGVPGMYVSMDMIPVYDRQIRQLKKAIRCLELFEKIEKRKTAVPKPGKNNKKIIKTNHKS
jgi:hypothetical protein